MRSPFVWLIAVLAIAGGVAAYWWQYRAEPPPAVAPQVAAAPTPAPAPAVPPAVEHPLPPPPVDAPPLPPLADSDRAAGEMLVNLFGREAFARFFVSDDVVRRFVATVDNLPRSTAAQRLFPVRPVPGAFVVAGADDAFVAGADNGLRYRPYVQVMEQVDAKRLAAAYIRHYPLFQTAYRELGYPDGYFNDRLVQAIDDMLAAPEPATVALVQPKVLYRYADPALESRSAGQKILMRMGAGNEARVKEKLRALRQEITAAPPPR
jgi:hypothetical protein